MKDKQLFEILKGLKEEINETLLFLCRTDFKIYGHITKSTVECFEKQRVQFPEILIDLVEQKTILQP